MSTSMKNIPWMGLGLLVILFVSGANTAKIIGQFTDPRIVPNFRHLVINDQTGHIYVGAKNRIYDLDSSLASVHTPVETGPKMDNLNCQPREGNTCYCLSNSDCEKVPTDSYNQGLALNIDGNVLYACSNLYYGSCSIITLSSFTELEQSYLPILSNDISMQDSSVIVLVAPGVDEQFGNLYVATTRSSIGYSQFTDSIPLIASRRLSDFELAQSETGTSSSIQPLHRYKDIFKVYYKFGFSYDGFTYFLAVQKSDSSDPLSSELPYVSRIIRVCQGDPKFYSYVEVPLICTVGGIPDNTFNLVQSAYIGRPGATIAETFGLQDEDEVLFALFSSSEDFSYIPRGPSAVCLYSLSSIAEIFKQNQKYCFDGLGTIGPKHLTSERRCVTTNFEEFECGQHSANHPIQGKFGDIISRVSSKIGNIVGTSVVAKEVGDFTVVYTGDTQGHLVKMVLYYDKISRGTRGSMFSNTSIDSEHKAILKDMALDESKDHLYMMSEVQVYKVQLSDCAQYTKCDNCRGSGDPHCGWCSSIDRCTVVEECPDAEYVWIDITQTCPNIISMTPEHLPYTASSSAVVKIKVMELPDAEDKDMRCHISAQGSETYRSRVFSNMFDRVLTCQGFHGLPQVDNLLGYINATLVIVINNRQWISHRISVFDCRRYEGCQRCTDSVFPCGWCVTDGLCIEEDGTCPTQGPIIISEAVNIIGQPSIVTNSGQSTAFTATCPYIEPIDDDYIVHAGHEAEMRIGAKNIKLWQDENDEYYSMGMNCVYTFPSGAKTVPASVQEDSSADEALVICQPATFGYVEDKGMLDIPMAVEWEFGHDLENPQDVQVSVYKCSAMVSNCGSCLTLDERYQCGWCQSVCTLEQDCPNWLAPGSVCPNPTILRFEPNSGPINGDTSVTVHGINLGRTPEDLVGYVRVAGIVCDVQQEGYVPSSSFVCVTRAAGRTISGPVSVSILGQYDYVTQTEYHYTEPTFSELIPNKGLTTGKTLVTLHGEDLGLGSELTVYVNDRECALKWRNNSQVIFETPKVVQPIVAHVRLQVDGTDYDLDLNFNYLPNPDILNIEPLHAIVSGGNLINVTGTNFDGVQRAQVTILESLENLLVDCMIIDASVIQCVSPSAIDLNLNIDPDVGLPLNYEFYFDQLIVSKEDIEETMGYEPLLLWGDPIIEDLEGRIQEYQGNKIYFLHGINLQVLRNFPDWAVHVGDTLCPGFRVGNNDDTIEFKAPSEALNVDSKGLANIVVSLGYYNSYPGSIQYEVINDNKIPLILGLTFGLVVPIILAILLIVVCLKRQSHKNNHKNRGALLTDNRGNYQPASMLPPPTEMRYSAATAEIDEEQGLIAESPATPDGDTESTTPNPDYVERLLNKIIDKKLRKEVAEIVISRERLLIGDVIGNGHFGCVYLASLKNENLTNASKVAVKTLQGDDFPPNMVTAFLEEGVVMKKFDHPHVLRLLGVGVGENEEPMVVIPFMSQGDLRTYVRNKEKSFTARQLLQLAQQVAKGMAYLASLNFVHRDLAARNCMIDEENVVKVADFGLSKNLFEKDYYSSTRDRKTKLPVKWMALESLEEFRFTIKSDVWSFGVLMWELMTRGTTPYADVDIFDLRTFLSEGRRLAKPKYCPDHVYAIMTDCWNKYPEYRPTFADLVNRLELLLNPPKKRESTAPSSEPMYVNFNEFDSAEYLNPISAPTPDTPGAIVESPSGPPTAPPPEPPREPTSPPPKKPQSPVV